MLMFHQLKKVVELRSYLKDLIKSHWNKQYNLTLQQFNFTTSNNQVKYEVLVAGMKLAHEMGVKKVKWYSDSQLVTSQIKVEYKAKELMLQKYYIALNDALNNFK